MTRQDHMNWCKERALEYVDTGDLKNAFASMSSDLQKHPETSNHVALESGMMLMMTGKLNTSEKMRRFIEDFN